VAPGGAAKLAVVGAGNVGASFAHAAVLREALGGIDHAATSARS
jgi:malate/lactate dehydrogenase